ncbi:MAG: MiaB/RimO family radical SAM methylthiotransferase [Spirochaetaceae bacterium]|nr:MiaB/RimO family radical SAM methylthiotransferase [Spirochaetaceae bacterium]
MTKFFLDQHGCAKNKVDGEILIARLEAAGYIRADSPEEAALMVINTCGFIEEAKKESLGALLEARAAYPDAKILLAGCLAQRYAADFSVSLPEADGIFGNGDLSLVDQAAAATLAGKRPVLTPVPVEELSVEREPVFSFPGSAYVKISEGCSNRCAFCAIPLIRGPLRNRPIPAILEEIRGLLGRGVFEINLVGQDLGASDLPALLDGISALPGDFWLRLLYTHPDHFPLGILPRIRSDHRLLPYFDLPFQSGSDPILHAMNRLGTAGDNVRLVEQIRCALAGGRPPAFRTTFLCGFPGETDGDAEATVGFLRAIRPHWSGCFTYSREEGTPAAKIRGQVPKKTAQNRVRRLGEVQGQITGDVLAGYIGCRETVLVEEVFSAADVGGADSSGGGSYAIGRAWFQAPEVDGAVILRYDEDDKASREAMVSGARVSARITGVSGVDLPAVYIGAAG